MRTSFRLAAILPCCVLLNVALLGCSAALAQALEGPAALVNPLIGTGNGGDVFPGADTPFGMVQFSPEESPTKANGIIAGPGGYAYDADAIRGFSLTNVSGWGCGGASGDVPLMPTTVAISRSPSTDFRRSYAETFSHANEQAGAGLYRVALDNGVEVALTATTHTGAARFAFPPGTANVLIRGSDSEVGSTAADVHIDAARNEVSGDVTSGNFCGYISSVDQKSYYTLHYVIVFDHPFASHGTWHDATVTPDGTDASGGTGFGNGFPASGTGSGAWVGFADGAGTTVHARIGISYVSEADARANLAAENPPGARFEAISDRAVASWNHALGRIEVTGGTMQQRVVFYTALYHALLHPNVFSDVNGLYQGFDGRTHHVDAGQQAQYANFSGWDVYRSELQLITWLFPKRASDIAQSLYHQSQQNGGVWDRWTHEGGTTHVMNGDPAAPAIADILAFGGRGFDASGALASLVHAAEVPTAADLSDAGCAVECVGERPGLDRWLSLHYIPTGAPSWGAASDSLEDSTADFAIASLATRLGRFDLTGRFLARAQYWRNVFNPAATKQGGYVESRNPDGSWALVDDGNGPVPFHPSTGDGFTEGTAAQYVWMVPFNERGLFNAIGGNQKVIDRLNSFFYDAEGALAVVNAGPLHADLSNEPSLETPWLYDYAGAPWRTQRLIRQVITSIWTDTPSGIPGNDDLGEMSSWLVWASLGLYPEVPGRAELVVASPLFSRAVVHRPGGDVTIVASGPANAPFVHALSLDGIPLDQPWLPEIFALWGGRLDFTLAASPDTAWGASPFAAPPSFDFPSLSPTR